MQLFDLSNAVVGEDFSKYKALIKLSFCREDLIHREAGKSKFDIYYSCLDTLKSMQLNVTDKELKDCLNYGVYGSILFYFEKESEADTFFKAGEAIMQFNRQYFNWTIENKEGIVNSNT
jgi:hypothetical protein